MIGRFFARINSRLQGLKIGEIRYVKGSPFIFGDIFHILPKELWTEEENQSLRYNVIVEEWDGWNWKFVEEKSFTKHELAKELNKLDELRTYNENHRNKT